MEIERREQALLRKYQTGNLSGVQFSVELENLRQTKAHLLNNEPRDPKLSNDEIHAKVKEYCERVRGKLKSAQFKIKQQILRHVINLAFVGDRLVRIEGAIATSSVQDDRASATPLPQEQTCNCRGLEFEIMAVLPPRKRRWWKRSR
jgi:hypothetical protein